MISAILLIVFLLFNYAVLGICWFLNRMGDKLGTDKRWWVKTLDVILIIPLLPLAYLIGKIR